VAMALAAMVMAISFPSIASGLDGVRLQSSGRRLAAFLNTARQRAERDQAPVEITVDSGRNQVRAMPVTGRWEQSLELADGVRILGEPGEESVRRWMVYPNVPPPRLRVRLGAGRGRSLGVEVDPLSGTPQIEEAR